MRDNTYMMAFLIATAVMLLAGLGVNSYEIYRYTSYKAESEATTTQPAETPPTSQEKPSGEDNEDGQSPENGDTSEP